MAKLFYRNVLLETGRSYCLFLRLDKVYPLKGGAGEEKFSFNINPISPIRICLGGRVAKSQDEPRYRGQRDTHGNPGFDKGCSSHLYTNACFPHAHPDAFFGPHLGA